MTDHAADRPAEDDGYGWWSRQSRFVDACDAVIFVGREAGIRRRAVGADTDGTLFVASATEAGELR